MKGFFDWLVAQIIVGMMKRPILIPVAILVIGALLGAAILAGVQWVIR